MTAPGRFLADIEEIRRRARQHLTDGAVTQNYGGKVEDAVALLNHAVATEIVCILRYKFHAVCATGLASEAVKEEFAQHAKEELAIRLAGVSFCYHCAFRALGEGIRECRPECR